MKSALLNIGSMLLLGGTQGCADSMESCERTLSCLPDSTGGAGESGGKGYGAGDGDGDSGGSETGGESSGGGGGSSGGGDGGTGNSGGNGTGGLGGEPFTCSDCTGSKPVCIEDDQKCVVCSGDDTGSCSETELCTPENTCVPCIGDDTPGCAEGEVCSSENKCVECTENTQCTDVIGSRCSDENTCERCIEDADCSHHEGKNVCDAGECVQCTATNATACGTDTADTGKPFLCDVLANTCSTTETEQSSGLCQPCIANAQCKEGQVCVMQSFGELPDITDVGYFCFWEKGASGGAPTSCLTEGRPYVDALDGQRTIDGTEASICGLAVTTCPGLADFRNPDTDCAPGGTPDDTLCGEPGLSDGYCRLAESPDIYRCTVPCGSVDDCPGSFACNTGVTPYVCEL